MNYFIDTEFLEGKQRERFPISLFRKFSNPTIDLISIGIVGEDGREYYAISKEFNLVEAWNRYDLKLPEKMGDEPVKVYWIRENVLYPIFADLFQRESPEIWGKDFGNLGNFMGYYERTGNGMKMFKELINKFGKTKNEIAKEVKRFVYNGAECSDFYDRWGREIQNNFYGYYADYDWVVFCWLFGKMIDLPIGFPMYCKDLKQILDEKAMSYFREVSPINGNLQERIDSIKIHPDYPKQENEHNALADARWNKKLYEFLKNL